MGDIATFHRKNCDSELDAYLRKERRSELGVQGRARYCTRTLTQVSWSQKVRHLFQGQILTDDQWNLSICEAHLTVVEPWISRVCSSQFLTRQINIPAEEHWLLRTQYPTHAAVAGRANQTTFSRSLTSARETRPNILQVQTQLT